MADESRKGPAQEGRVARRRLTISNHLDPAIRVMHPVQLLQEAMNR